ncbi:MAG: fliS [Acidimicrobiales bacterium]|nr:fliS [Acidimicrobiales bacterium]
MARTAAVRTAYSNDTIVTTPERLITMLYDRLVRDLVSGEAAIERQDREVANEVLVHAQEIVFELLSALDVDGWEGGEALASLYTWLLKQLVEANIQQDAGKVTHCRSLVEPLAAAWHVAANEVSSSAFGTAV